MSLLHRPTPLTVALVLTEEIREYLEERAIVEDRSLSAVARRIIEAEMKRQPARENGRRTNR